MSSARRASNGFTNRQIIRRITWLATPGGLIPTVLLCLLALIYWLTWYSQPNEAFFQLAIGLGILSLLASILISWLTARRLSFSMQKLAQAMEKFASGLWDERAIVRQDDPLVNLALLFNRIADDYRAAFQSLTVRQPEAPHAHNPIIEQISSQVASAHSLDILLSATLESIARSLAAAYAAVYLVEQEETGQKRYLNLVYSFKSPGFDPGRLRAAESSPPGFPPDIPGVRIALDKTGQLDWPVKRSVVTGKSIIQESASEKEIMEAAVPLVRNERTIGVVDLFVPARSSEPRAATFSYRSLWEVEQAAGLVALAMESILNEQETRTLASADGGQCDIQTMRLFQAGSQVARAASEDEARQAIWQALDSAPHPCVLLLSHAGKTDQLQVFYQPGQTPPLTAEGEPAALTIAALATHFNAFTPLIVTQINPVSGFSTVSADRDNQGPDEQGLPRPLLELAEALGRQTVAFLPVLRSGQLCALMLVGLPKQDAGAPMITALEPYRNLVEVLVNSLENLRSTAQTQRQLAELRAFWNIGQAISIETDLEQLFVTIHRQLETVLGELRSFAIALYDAGEGTIRIPYMIEEGGRLEAPPFPLGEGLTSILIRTGKPLLLCDDVEAQSKALGAKVLGEPAKSWLGAPMLYGGEIIGAIIVQDILHAGRFNEDDQRLLSALASEVAVVVHNARLLEATRQQARQERLINEISAKIRRSSDIQTILKTTAVELGAALRVQKAHIRLGIEDEPTSLETGGGR